MRIVPVGLVWLASLGVVWLSAPWEGPVTRAYEPDVRPRPRASAPASPPVPRRHLFRFQEAASSAARLTPPPAVALAPPAVMPSLPTTPRVLGIVTSGNGLRALISVGDETSLLAPGETFRGYEVLSLDGELVRLRSMTAPQPVIELRLD